ncbi:MAG: cysteine desulfurase [Ruminococcaceae bacterium]|nr:cysteine desulfurase [Oscillospiraceae bacterium]
MKEIYLDNSATTALSQRAKEKMLHAMEIYGNPSSLHTMGQTAHAMIEEARASVARSLGLRAPLSAGQLLFTSCGSEADNLAVLGCAYAKERRRGGYIVTTDSEHPGVLRAMEALERDGFHVLRIPTVGGVLDWERYCEALEKKPFLVSVMAVNNETGAMYDIQRAFAMAKAKDPDIVTHTDAVQAYLKCRLAPQALSCDLMTLSGHKIHAPKGVGALYVSADAKRRRDIVPTLLGGGQEFGFRSGTENVIGIAAFGAAAEDGYLHLAERVGHMSELLKYTEERLSSLPVRMHIPRGARAPHILNFALPDIKSETAVHALSARGIFVSSGSACSSHAKSVSAALLAFGIGESEAECSLRISLSHENTREEIDLFVSALEQALGGLVRIHR